MMDSDLLVRFVLALAVALKTASPSDPAAK